MLELYFYPSAGGFKKKKNSLTREYVPIMGLLLYGAMTILEKKRDLFDTIIDISIRGTYYVPGTSIKNNFAKE